MDNYVAISEDGILVPDMPSVSPMATTGGCDIPYVMSGDPSGRTVFTGPWIGPQMITVSWDSVVETQCGLIGYYLDLFDHTGALLNHYTESYVPGTPATISYNLTSSETQLFVAFYQPSYCGGGTAYNVHITGGSCAAEACPYGTERNPDAATYTYITTTLVNIVATILGGGPIMLTVFDALLGSPLIAYPCDAFPPIAPTFTDDDFLGDTGLVKPGSWWKLMQLFRTGVWYFYCRCKDSGAGGPRPPLPPPPPVGPPLDNPSPQPKLPCSDSDPCTTYNIIVRYLNSISLNIQYNRQTNNYFPGPNQAFNYQLSTPHAGLSGAGVLSISGIVGFKVEVTHKPDSTLILGGTPGYLWNMGWMSIDDTDGMIEEKRVTRDSYVWLPERAAQASAFGYYLAPEVVITVWELIPGPT